MGHFFVLGPQVGRYWLWKHEVVVTPQCVCKSVKEMCVQGCRCVWAAWMSLSGAVTPCVTPSCGLCLSARDWKPLSFSQKTRSVFNFHLPDGKLIGELWQKWLSSSWTRFSREGHQKRFCICFHPPGASEFSRPWESEGPHPSESKTVQWKETGPRPSGVRAQESSQSFEWPQTQEYGFRILARWTHSGYQRQAPPSVLMSSACPLPDPSSGKTASSSQEALAQNAGMDRMAAGLFQWMEPLTSLSTHLLSVSL